MIIAMSYAGPRREKGGIDGARLALGRRPHPLVRAAITLR